MYVCMYAGTAPSFTEPGEITSAGSTPSSAVVLRRSASDTLCALFDTRPFSFISDQALESRGGSWHSATANADMLEFLGGS